MVSVVGLLLVPNVVCHNIRGKYSAGDMMQPIRRPPKHDTLGMFLPYSDPVVNVPAEFSPANEGGRTNFRNPASNPHSLGLPYSPAGEHNTWPSPAEGYGSVHDREQKAIVDLALSDDVTTWGWGRTRPHLSRVLSDV